MSKTGMEIAADHIREAFNEIYVLAVSGGFGPKDGQEAMRIVRELRVLHEQVKAMPDPEKKDK